MVWVKVSRVSSKGGRETMVGRMCETGQF